MAKQKITIEYARKKLGKRGQQMTDQQIADLLSTLRVLCNNAVDASVEGFSLIQQTTSYEN